MELFFYTIVGLLLIISYLLGREKPTILRALLFFGSLIILAGMIFFSGIDIPNTGISYDGAAAIFTSTNFSIGNNLLVFAAGWLSMIFGIRGLFQTIIKSTSGGVNPDGSFK